MSDFDLPAPPRPRNRLITRLQLEMQVSGGAEMLHAFDGEFDRSVIFILTAREGGAMPPLAAGHASLDRQGAPSAISINALAASLSRPFETVRRHVNAMIDGGLCERSERGVTVPADIFERPRIAHMLARMHDGLVRLTEDLAAFGLPLPPPRPHVLYDPRVGVAAALDAALSVVEFTGPEYSDWMGMVVAGNVMTANARPFTYDRELAFAYAELDTVPPEELRKPVRIAGLAQALGVPYSTLRRHAERLLSEGKLVRRKGGVICSQSWLANPQLLAKSRSLAEHNGQILSRLAAGGFPFDDPASCYLAGRPPLLDYG